MDVRPAPDSFSAVWDRTTVVFKRWYYHWFSRDDTVSDNLKSHVERNAASNIESKSASAVAGS